jgi:hypothetical protein
MLVNSHWGFEIIISAPCLYFFVSKLKLDSGWIAKDEYFKMDDARKHDIIVESRNGIGPQGSLVVV